MSPFERLVNAETDAALERISEDYERQLYGARTVAELAAQHGYPYPVANADDEMVARDWLLERGVEVAR